MTQLPVPPSHWSVVQGLPSSQTLAEVGLHKPILQMSPKVHGLASLHGVPLSGWVKQTPVPGSQPSLVQESPSSQVFLVPGTQVLFAQRSLKVQAFPSVHGAVLALAAQPLSGSQLSSVHGLASSQVTASPGVQMPATQ